MILKKTAFFSFLMFFCLLSFSLRAQIDPGIYIADNENVRHELKMTDKYLIHTVYEKSPARFIETKGGFYDIQGQELHIKLEFNSNQGGGNSTDLKIPFTSKDAQLVFETNPKLLFSRSETEAQDLDGQWLFATRGPDNGQKRRGESNTRKTLKYLQDGRFQWIAYDTEGMQFKGSGGGSYTSKDGIYIENIEFFSRDNSRVGASLEFNYELKKGEWHHTGKNSKGEPMYEIWGKRN